MTENPYEYFLTSKTASKWKKFGAIRRSGVLAPLFSLFSAESIGIGEIPDLKLLADWCEKCGMSIIQLLPLNDTGFDFAPYSCQSTFALEPMYLRLNDIKGVEIINFQQDLNSIKSKCAAGQKKVNYKIKKLKLKLLLKMFKSIKANDVEFETFKKTNKFWLNDYAVYKVLKDKYEQKTWE
ncbi:MAG: 4-alpha-glucanotransferase, partial [bacterium]